MLLEVRQANVCYGDAPAVWDATLEIDAGQIVACLLYTSDAADE